MFNYVITSKLLGHHRIKDTFIVWCTKVSPLFSLLNSLYAAAEKCLRAYSAQQDLLYLGFGCTLLQTAIYCFDYHNHNHSSYVVGLLIELYLNVLIPEGTAGTHTISCRNGITDGRQRIKCGAIKLMKGHFSQL